MGVIEKLDMKKITRKQAVTMARKWLGNLDRLKARGNRDARTRMVVEVFAQEIDELRAQLAEFVKNT